LKVPDNIKMQTGQMLMAGLKGMTLDQDAEDLIKNHHIGGFILFDRNFESPDQLADFISDLQTLSQSHSPGVPLFISVDQEGGRVARLKAPFTDFPFAGVLGQAKSEALAYKFGTALAEELTAVGINMDFAPVLDVHTNPANPVIGDRALSADPEWAGKLGGAIIRAFNDKGLLPVGKHFPGHGDTHLDSHLELPTVYKDKEALENVELIPFIRTIKEGLDAIMMAHVVYPSWDPDYPATFSETILERILRKQLGFHGIAFSDDLDMKAIEDHVAMESIPSLGIQAGLDVFLVCHDNDKIRTLHDLMIKGVERGDISREKVGRAVQRIVAVKSKINITRTERPNEIFCAFDHRNVVEEMKSFMPS